MTQEKVWQPKDIIYAKDVLLFLNPTTKEIEFWVCGKSAYCKIENICGHCDIVQKIPENLFFLNRNLEQELYEPVSLNKYKEYYTKHDSDMMYLIAKIRRLELMLTAQNLNKETFKQAYQYHKTKWHPSKPVFFALGKREVLLSLSQMDKNVHKLTKNMFFDCIACLQYNNQMQKLKHHETQHYMAHMRSWKFFKGKIPRIENRNKFFTYYELILYKEFLNMNYTKKLNSLFAYQNKLEEKIKNNQLIKDIKQKQEAEKENSKELYKF